MFFWLKKITWSYHSLKSVDLSGEIVGAFTAPSCSQFAFSTFVPQAGTLTNWATSYFVPSLQTVPKKMRTRSCHSTQTTQHILKKDGWSWLLIPLIINFVLFVLKDCVFSYSCRAENLLLNTAYVVQRNSTKRNLHRRVYRVTYLTLCIWFSGISYQNYS